MRRLLADPLWVRAPIQLLRYPALLLAVTLAAVVLGLVSASGPLYLASAGQAALDLELGDRSRASSGLTVEVYGSTSPGLVEQADVRLRRAVAGLEPDGHLDDATLRLLPSTNVRRTVRVPEGDSDGRIVLEERVQLYAQRGALDHITPVDGLPVDDPSRPEGLWVSDRVATAEGDAYVPGDTITLELLASPQQVPVTGVYRDLDDAPATDFWQPVELLYTARETTQGTEVPAPLLLGEPDVVLGLAERLAANTSHTWRFPRSEARLAPAEARALNADLTRLEERVRAERDELGESLLALAAGSFNLGFTTTLDSALERAATTARAVDGPVRALALGGTAVALVLVGAAAAFRVRRRQVEVRVLAADGVAPATQALRGTVEATLPLLLGALAGAWLARLLVDALGPTALVAATPATSQALRATLLAVAVGLVALGAVTAAASAREPRVEAEGPSRAAQLAGRFPWEAVSLALAGAAWYSLRLRGPDALRESGEEAEIDLLVLAFPVLLIAGLAGLAARGLRALLPLAHGPSAGWPTPAFLAVRRLADTPRSAVLLVTAAALALGVLVYAGTVAASTEETALAKARGVTGGDVRVDLAPSAVVPDDLPAGATVVTAADVDVVPGEFAVEVLTVDPSTFADGAYTDGLFDRPVEELLAALIDDDGPRLPALVIPGDGEPALPSLPVLQTSRWSLPITPVGSADAFPTVRPDRTTIVVADQPYLDRVDAQQPRTDQRLLAEERVLARGDAPADDLLAELGASGVELTDVTTVEATLDRPSLRATGWALSYLVALGALAGVLAVAGVVLYLQERQSARTVAFAIAGRMGLRRGQHALAVGLELGAMLLSAGVVGGVLALLAARLALPRLDPIPALPPAPVLALPVGLLLVVAVGVTAASLVGAWLVQRTAERADLAEVLRLAR